MTAFALLLAALPAAAQIVFNSPTAERLQGAAENAAVASQSPEQARTLSGDGFTGEDQDLPGPPPTPVPEPQRAEGDRPTYVFRGESKMPGVTLYTPVPDPTGGGSTEREGPKPLISPKLIYGAGGLGAAGVIGGALLGGFFGGLLLVVGGALLGAAAVGWFINKKTRPKN